MHYVDLSKRYESRHVDDKGNTLSSSDETYLQARDVSRYSNLFSPYDVIVIDRDCIVSFCGTCYIG